MSENGRAADSMPQTIGRYQVHESIGFGAMGAVYKAFDPLIKRTLAIKTIRLDIPRQSPQYKSFIDRFYHEARISGTLSHPNIVTLFDIGEENGLPYLAMEFVEGETIASIVEKGSRFKPEKVINLVSQVASAIDYAHSKGVIHRDIKPSNLILSDGERVKVTDFGIAKLIDAEMTQSGTLLGTPSYMSPEQAMGDKLDGRSDIFSLGVCAFEMLAGEQPFPGNNVTSILYKLVHVEPVQPTNLEMNGLVPQKWHEVFGKVLAKKPDDRYQTATEFVQDLEYCLGSWFGALSDMTMADPPPLAASSDATTVMPAMAEQPPIEVTMAMPAPDVPQRGASERAAPLQTMIERSPLAPPPDMEGTVVMPALGMTDTGASSMGEGTVVMEAPLASPAPANPAETDGTVVMAAPARLTPPPPPEAEGTVVMRAPSPPAGEGTVLMQAPMAAPPVDSGLRAPLAPFADDPTTGAPSRKSGPITIPLPPKPTATAAMPPIDAPRKKSMAALALAGGGLGLLVLLAMVGGAVWFLRHRAPETDPAVTPPPPVTAQPVATAPAPTPAPTVKGTLHVESDPAGATVTLNGEARGVTPLDVPDLFLGNHEVTVELKGYAPITQTIVLSAETPAADLKVPLSKSAPAMGVVEIVSSPPGAIVRVDGVGVGQTPLPSHSLKVGRHQVELLKEGYEPWSSSVMIGRRKARIDAPLKPIVKAVPTVEPKSDEPDPHKTYDSSDVETQPKQISGSSASYPKEAPKLRPGQPVTVGGNFVVTLAGEVTEIKITESAGNKYEMVDQAVMASLAKRKYAPGTKKGVKVKVRVTFKQTFQAN